MDLKTNTGMYQLIQNKIKETSLIDKCLTDIVNSEFISVYGCWFLNSLFEKQKHIDSSDFKDKTGYECFINSLHIDDYIKEDFLKQSFLLMAEIATKWSKLESNRSLRFILSETDFGMNLKFHAVREKESWILEQDIEKFKEPLLILTI